MTETPPPMPEAPEPVEVAESVAGPLPGDSHIIPPESEWPAEGAPIDEEAAARYDGQ